MMGKSQLGRIRWVVLIPLLLLVGYSLWLFDFGKQHGANALVSLRQDYKLLEKKLGQEKDERQALQGQSAILERSSQIDRQAALGVRKEVAELQDQILELRKELTLYKGIVAPGEVKPGLRVQRLKIEATDEENLFIYNMTLTQIRRRGHVATGTVTLEVIGKDGGASAVILFNKLADDGEKPLKFKFRNFQHFEGEIRLPRDFQPRRVRVKLAPSGRKPPPAAQKEFPWP